jgi:hypothetical protein
MSRENIQRIKKAIELYEWNRGWYKKVSGDSIKIKKFRIAQNYYKCDIHYFNNDKEEIYCDVIYPKKIIDELLVRS